MKKRPGNNSSANTPLNEAKQITQSLKRIRKSMELGLNQADLAVSVLAEDGESIRDTYHDHKYELKNALQHTKKNLNRVKNIEERERYSLFFSMLFFTSTVVYIIAKRFRLISLIWLSIHGLFSSSNKIGSNNDNNINTINKVSITRSKIDGKIDNNHGVNSFTEGTDFKMQTQTLSLAEEDVLTEEVMTEEDVLTEEEVMTEEEVWEERDVLTDEEVWEEMDGLLHRDHSHYEDEL